MRAVFIKRSCSNFTFIRRSDHKSRLAIQLDIWKTTRSSTIHDILNRRLSSTHSNASVISRIRGITSITLRKDAYLLPGDSVSARPFIAKTGGLASISIKHSGVDERTCASIREICRFISPDRSCMSLDVIKALRKDLVINVINRAHIRFWVQELPSVLRLEPKLRLDFVVSAEMNKKFMMEHVNSLIGMYESLWPSLRIGRGYSRHSASTAFFTLHNVRLSDTGEVEACPYLVSFTALRRMLHFRVLVLHNTALAKDPVPLVVFDDEYPGLQEQQPSGADVAGRNIAGEDDDTDDETDISSVTQSSDDEE